MSSNVIETQEFLGLDDDQMRTLITEARGWLADVFADYRDRDYRDHQVLHAIDFHYVGSTRQFANDIAPLLERTEA